MRSSLTTGTTAADGANRGLLSFSEPPSDISGGSGEDVKTGVGEVVMVGEEVSVGSGEVVEVGIGEEVMVGVREGLIVGAGEDVGVGIGEEVMVGEREGLIVGAGEDVGVMEGVGEVVGTVVTGSEITVIYSERLKVLKTVMFRTVRFTVYEPGVIYTCSGFFNAFRLVLNHVPSPNDQFQREGNPPVELSENRTVSGAVPFSVDAIKSSTRGGIPLAYFRSVFPKSR
jgi:hypothetical protein